MKVTAQNLVNMINQLDKNKYYNYINERNRGKIAIVRVDMPEGPIIIKRWNSDQGKTYEKAKEESISTNMLWRVANSLVEGVPINIDRVLGASYNTRSVLESLLSYTSEFYYSYPGRIENTNSCNSIKQGHKHLMYLPNNPHITGVPTLIKTDQVISEIPSQQIIYESIAFDDGSGYVCDVGCDIETKRRHTQIQIALVVIGRQLGFRTWIAKNDRGVIYNEKKIGEMDGVVATLNDEKILSSYQDAVKAAQLIDCIWFKNGRLMPAIMEVEYTTGITSGLSRMKTFYDLFPPIQTRYVIVAPDDDRPKFLREATKEQFKALKPKFFSFSAVEELYSLCQRRKLKGITEEFLDCYMEPVAIS